MVPANAQTPECIDCQYEPELRTYVRCAHFGNHYVCQADMPIFHALGEETFVVETSFPQEGAVRDQQNEPWFHGPLTLAAADAAYVRAEEALLRVTT